AALARPGSSASRVTGPGVPRRPGGGVASRGRRRADPPGASGTPGGQTRGPDAGPGGGRGVDRGRPLVIPAAPQACRGRPAAAETPGVEAEGVPGGRPGALDGVGGAVRLAPGHGRFAAAVPCRRLPGAGAGDRKGARPEGGVVAELVPEGAQGGRGRADAAGPGRPVARRVRGPGELGGPDKRKGGGGAVGA